MGATGPKSRGKAAGSTGAARGTVAQAAVSGSPTSAASASVKRSFTIPSDFSASRDVQLAIMQDVEAHGFDDEAVFAIRISLEEAIVNAIRHGNRLDARKLVRVESDVNAARVEITVEDEGVGFDRKQIPDPTHEENLCRPNGRGILLIESYMNRVRWEQGGRRVFMAKDAAPSATA
jgi:serine/threonine-protein kinase RsbW